MPGNVNEQSWNKAKDIFKKSYGHEPKTSSDFAILQTIYKKIEHIESHREMFNDKTYREDFMADLKNFLWKNLNNPILTFMIVHYIAKMLGKNNTNGIKEKFIHDGGWDLAISMTGEPLKKVGNVRFYRTDWEKEATHEVWSDSGKTVQVATNAIRPWNEEDSTDICNDRLCAVDKVWFTTVKSGYELKTPYGEIRGDLHECPKCHAKYLDGITDRELTNKLSKQNIGDTHMDKKEKINYDKYIKDYETLSKTDFLNKHKDLTAKDWEDLNLKYRYLLNRGEESLKQNLNRLKENDISNMKDNELKNEYKHQKMLLDKFGSGSGDVSYFYELRHEMKKRNLINMNNEESIKVDKMQNKKELLKFKIKNLKKETIRNIKSMKEEYNGWKNYETWNVALWLDNDQGSQEMVLDMARNVKDSETATVDLADQLKDMVEENNPLNDQSSMYTDLLNAAISEVDFMEIANNYLELIKGESQ